MPKKNKLTVQKTNFIIIKNVLEQIFEFQII